VGFFYGEANMERASIVSSNIDEIGFRDNTLFIRFHSGVVYSYADCGYHIYDALKKAESAGKFFHRWIKGKFQCTRLEKDPLQLA
jgi:hypothetical protein